MDERPTSEAPLSRKKPSPRFLTILRLILAGALTVLGILLVPLPGPWALVLLVGAYLALPPEHRIWLRSKTIDPLFRRRASASQKQEPSVPALESNFRPVGRESGRLPLALAGEHIRVRDNWVELKAINRLAARLDKGTVRLSIHSADIKSEYRSREMRKNESKVLDRLERHLFPDAFVSQTILKMAPCTLVATSKEELRLGAVYRPLFAEDALWILSYAGDDSVLRIPYSDLHEPVLEGPGEVTSSLGLWGGGFGLEGAAKGILAASVVNSLTAQTSINTFIRLMGPHLELSLHDSFETPEDLRNRLAPVIVRIRGHSQGQPSARHGDVADLQQLSTLYQKGLLSKDEFALAKKRLLNQENSPEATGDA